MDENLLRRLAFIERAYYFLYSTPSILVQYSLCLVTLLWAMAFAIAQTPFHLSCRVILLSNCISCLAMAAAHFARLFFVMFTFDNYLSWDAIWFLNYFHACADGLYTVLLFVLLIERNFVIYNPKAYERHKKMYYMVVTGGFLIAIGVSVALGVMMYTSILLANISTVINNILLLLTIVGCGYCLYIGKMLHRKGSYWSSLESKYRVSEGVELFRSVIPVCATSGVLKFLGMLPLWVGQIYIEFNLIAYAIYYLTNTLSVLTCILILLFRNKALRKRLSKILRLKSCEPRIKVNMDSSGETYFKQLEQHWK